jgi:hypothetical protein
LDYLLLLSEQHLAWVVKAYVQYFNMSRPHQGLGQQVPAVPVPPLPPPNGTVVSLLVLGGLHHSYQWAA